MEDAVEEGGAGAAAPSSGSRIASDIAAALPKSKGEIIELPGRDTVRHSMNHNSMLGNCATV